MDDRRDSAEQYKTPDRLRKRISIHEKYSVNPQSFADWIFAQYDLFPGARVLELGCGTGDMWKGRIGALPRGASLVLSDLSEGMLDAARTTLGEAKGLEYRRIDIQDIPFPDGAFDLVIANMMLYHVPDLDRGLAEARRVLREGGTFACATYGEGGMVDFLAKKLPGFGLRSRLNNAFTLQNGGQRLRRFFASVERRLYPDELRVTNLDDLVDYLCSLGSMVRLRPERRGELRDALAALAPDGVLVVPKEYGLFLCA